MEQEDARSEDVESSRLQGMEGREQKCERLKGRE